MPVNRLKILAFVFGAAIAGLAGCIFASILTAVTGGNFDLPVLITIYAIVILGGLGSLTGVVVGAIVINVSFQVLAPENPQSNARLLFYGVILLLIVLQLRRGGASGSSWEACSPSGTRRTRSSTPLRRRGRAAPSSSPAGSAASWRTG